MVVEQLKCTLFPQFIIIHHYFSHCFFFGNEQASLPASSERLSDEMGSGQSRAYSYATAPTRWEDLPPRGEAASDSSLAFVFPFDGLFRSTDGVAIQKENDTRA